MTDNNIHRLTLAVRNGPFRHPGANFVQKADGTMYDLRFRNTNMIELVKGDRVLRHLVDNDPVLICRQPSLHRMNIMCHKAKIMRDLKTFALPIGVTTPYNADFDGDEMNIYIPRNEMV